MSKHKGGTEHGGGRWMGEYSILESKDRQAVLRAVGRGELGLRMRSGGYVRTRGLSPGSRTSLCGLTAGGGTPLHILFRKNT